MPSQIPELPNLSKPFWRVLLTLTVLFPMGATGATAQTRDRGPLVLELPASTRALALGNSFALGSGDSDAVFYHPGVLSRVQGLTGSVQRFGSASTLTTLSAGQSWLSGGVVLGIQHLSYGANPTETELAKDLLGLPEDVGSLREDGAIGVSELAASVGYGRAVRGVQMGVVGKLVEQRFGPHKGITASFDFGVSAAPGPVTLGLAVQNLGPDMTIGGEEIPLPLRYALGASTRAAPVGPLDISGSGAVTYRTDGDVIPSVGVEVGYWPVTGRTFVARVGFRHLPEEQSGSPFTFGGGFTGDDITLTYAYEGFESGDPSHRFSLGWR